MVARRNSIQSGEEFRETSALAEIPDTGNGAIAARTAPSSTVAWSSEDATVLAEILEIHGIGTELGARLVALASAPDHARRPVDRLAIALGAHFNFFALEEAWQMPILLCGLPGAGTSTLAAKLATRFDESEVMVIGAGAHDAAEAAAFGECLEALDLPLIDARDATTLARVVAEAGGRKVIIDLAPETPLDGRRLREFASAASASGILVMSGECAAAEARAVATTASAVGIDRMVLTRLDVARYLGPALAAADTAKLALLGASVTPHFGFGFRALTPENLARRLISAALYTERWRAAPL